MVRKINKNSINKFLLILPYLLITILFVIIPLILILVKSLTPATDLVTNEKLPLKENWNFFGETIFQKIGYSFLLATISTFFCIIIGYAFAYFLSLSKKMSFKIVAIVLITSPIWISVLVKLVGLKTLFDFINGAPNSTYGSIYTIIGFIYLNLPIFILNVYSHINSLPKNLLQASKDLGKNAFQTFYSVVIPYTKNAIISGAILVFLPTLTTAGVAQFLDNSNNGGTIGGDILNQGIEGTSSQIALARVSSLSLVVCTLILVLWVIFVLVPKTIKKAKLKKNNGRNYVSS